MTSPPRCPTRVGASDIEQIRTAESVFAGWDFAYGGGLVRDAVMAQLRYCARLLDATCPDRLRPELHAALGALADTAGYMCFDTGAYNQARRVFGFALACAERAGTGRCGLLSWTAWPCWRSGPGDRTRA
ncbi:MAG TPA: hypothetical protein VFO16_23350 [Pseudonocardiaceae bacterium]|nr:hypothetical protein [Pseudonocardiaceae bacterium]